MITSLVLAGATHALNDDSLWTPTPEIRSMALEMLVSLMTPKERSSVEREYRKTCRSEVRRRLTGAGPSADLARDAFEAIQWGSLADATEFVEDFSYNAMYWCSLSLPHRNGDRDPDYLAGEAVCLQRHLKSILSLTGSPANEAKAALVANKLQEIQDRVRKETPGHPSENKIFLEHWNRD